MTVAGEQANADGVSAGQEPIPIVLDFVNPVRADRWSLGRGWKTGLNEAGGASTLQHPASIGHPRLGGESSRPSARADAHAAASASVVRDGGESRNVDLFVLNKELPKPFDSRNSCFVIRSGNELIVLNPVLMLHAVDSAPHRGERNHHICGDD